MMKDFCTVEDISVMTGLSVRTIRSYLASGQLEGEKVDGAWRFTAEQFSKFLTQDMVRQSVQAKEHGRVYEFMMANRREKSEACVIWDWPVEEQEETLRERLMEKVNSLGLGCAYHYERGMARAILTGSPSVLAELLQCRLLP